MRSLGDILVVRNGRLTGLLGQGWILNPQSSVYVSRYSRLAHAYLRLLWRKEKRKQARELGPVNPHRYLVRHPLALQLPHRRCLVAAVYPPRPP